ncbi:MAG: hypothetical protein ABIO58_02785 [Luteimonas sp.]
MSLRRPLPSCLLVAMLAAASAVASAAPPRARHSPPPSAPATSRQHGDDPLSDSVRRIERKTQGQILSAERVPFDGRSVNRIKIVDDRGRVRVYMDDPQSRKPQQPEPPTRGDDD